VGVGALVGKRLGPPRDNAATRGGSCSHRGEAARPQDASVTLNVYADAIPDDDTRAVDVFSRAIWEA